MKKFKIILIITLLILFEGVMLFYSFITYKKGILSGHKYSFLELITLFLTLIPIICGIIGLFLKNNLGWTLTISIFYLMLILGIVSGFQVGFGSTYELLMYILFITPMFFSLAIMNGKDLKGFYKIDGEKKLIWENVISFVTTMIYSTLLIAVNG